MTQTRRGDGHGTESRSQTLRRWYVSVLTGASAAGAEEEGPEVRCSAAQDKAAALREAARVAPPEIVRERVPAALPGGCRYSLHSFLGS